MSRLNSTGGVGLPSNAAPGDSVTASEVRRVLALLRPVIQLRAPAGWRGRGHHSCWGRMPRTSHRSFHAARRVALIA